MSCLSNPNVADRKFAGRGDGGNGVGGGGGGKGKGEGGIGKCANTTRAEFLFQMSTWRALTAGWLVDPHAEIKANCWLVGGSSSEIKAHCWLVSGSSSVIKLNAGWLAGPHQR